MSEKKLIEMFPDLTDKYNKRKSVTDYGPDDPVATRDLRRAVWMIVFAIIGMLLLLFSIGLVAALGRNGNW